MFMAILSLGCQFGFVSLSGRRLILLGQDVQRAEKKEDELIVR